MPMSYFLKRHMQTDDDGIIRCAIAISNFSMWDKLLHYSVRKLQEENYDSLLVLKIPRHITLDRNTA